MIVIIPVIIATILLSYFGEIYRLPQVHQHLLYFRNVLQIAAVAPVQFVETVKVATVAYFSPLTVEITLLPTRTISFAEYAKQAGLHFDPTPTLPLFIKEESILPRLFSAIFVLIVVATLVVFVYNASAYQRYVLFSQILFYSFAYSASAFRAHE